ncbi:hypothetical protein B296_00034734, partial [Ensete ventricosum]
MFTARYGRYIPVCQVAGTRTARYQAIPPKIDRWRLISAVGGRLSEKNGGRRRRGKRRKKKKREKIPIARVRSSPVCRRRSRVAGALSPARGERLRR